MARRLVPGAFKRALSTTQGFSTAAGARPDHTKRQEKQGNKAAARHLLKVPGFAKYSCREDLWALIDEAQVPRSAVKSVDSVLSYSGLLPTNTYILELHTADALTKLRDRGFHMRNGSIMSDEVMSEEELNKLPLGSKWSVDERCVRVARVPPRIDVDELSFFFRDFNLAPDGIEKIPMRVQPRSPFNAFIVRLESPDEAQRLVREMQHAKLGGAPISIVLYK